MGYHLARCGFAIINDLCIAWPKLLNVTLTGELPCAQAEFQHAELPDASVQIEIVFGAESELELDEDLKYLRRNERSGWQRSR